MNLVSEKEFLDFFLVFVVEIVCCCGLKVFVFFFDGICCWFYFECNL